MDYGEARTLAEVTALEPLPDDPSERLEHLRLIALAEGLVMDTCPECGQPLEGLDIQAHADWHWPHKAMSEALQANGGEPTEAHRRKASLIRAAKARRPATKPGKSEEDD